MPGPQPLKKLCETLPDFVVVLTMAYWGPSVVMILGGRYLDKTARSVGVATC
jgi:hypothetical protein